MLLAPVCLGARERLQVPKASGKASSERLPGWSFQRWDHDSTRMNLINLPMGESVVARKLTVRSDDPDGKTTGKRAQVCGDVRQELAGLGVRAKQARVQGPAEAAASATANTNLPASEEQAASSSLLDLAGDDGRSVAGCGWA